MTKYPDYIQEQAGIVQSQIYIDRLIGNETDYIVAHLFRFSQQISLERVEAVLNGLTQAHEILRTVVFADSDSIKQRIFRKITINIIWNQNDASDAHSLLESLAYEDCDQIEGEPRVRYYAFGLDRDHISAIGMIADHCLVDEESFEIFRVDMETILNSGSLQWESRFQYSDFVDWEQSQKSEASKYLAGRYCVEERKIDADLETTSLSLASSSINTHGKNKREVVNYICHASLAEEISKYSKLSQASHFQIFLKIIQICLCRWRSLNTCTVSSPVSFRIHDELSKVAGPILHIEQFVHIQDTNQSFSQQVRDIRAEVLKRLTSPFARNSDFEIDSDNNQDRTRHEVFLVVDTYRKLDVPRKDFQDTNIIVERDSVSLSNKSAGSLLINIIVDEISCKIILEAKYDPNLFNDRELNDLFKDIDTISNQLVRKANLKVKDVLYDLGLQAFKSRQEPSIKSICYDKSNYCMVELLRRLEIVMASVPTKPAIIDRHKDLEVSFSYGEISDSSYALALFLQEQGIGSGNYVGIVTESLSSFVIASIATMCIGATFVPFEPEFFKKEPDPLAKFNIVNYWIIADSLSSRVSIEQTRSCLKESQLQLIAKQRIGLVKSGLPDCNLIDSAAYVMYTSGTTGKPKGVLIPADGILKLHDEFRLKGWNDTTRVLCASNRGFDASTFEIWPTFLSGGTLIQASKDELLNPLKLNQVIQEFSLTAAWLTKTVFDLIIQINPVALVGLQDLIIGGEPLSEKYVELFLTYAEGKVRLWNGYGPTETTTFATLDQITLNDDRRINPIYIGTSVIGNTLYILGPDLEHLPKGCIGEAFISGAGVSLGYVGNEEATASSFLKDPYSCSGDDMMFKTGDFFEIIDYGVYKYIGRKDNLVKIKGFRVSTSTIQNTITRMEGIADAAVLARNYTGRSQLVAFVCIRQDCVTTPEDIRTYLTEQLSHYMVPSIIKIVDGIPINKNGKIDSDVLINSLDTAARIEGNCNELLVNESNYVIILRDVWGIILGLDSVPLRQSLYVLGADSFGFVRCCILLAEHGISVTPQELIPFTTIVDQAAVVEDLATRQGLVRDSTSTLGHYQKLLYESRRYDKRTARAVYTSIIVEKEYDALAVGMALFRLFSIHPTLDVRQYMHNFYDRDDSSIRPIVVVELDNIYSTEELDRRAIAAVFSDLSLDIIPFKAFIGYGKDYNYLAIAIDNLVCSLTMIERIAKKASCWLSLESGLDWNWSLFYNVIDNETSTSNITSLESNKALDKASIRKSSESLVHSSLTFIDLASCYSEAIHWLKDQRGSNYGRVFISTDGFLDATKKETTTQSSMIIELGQFSDLSQLERSSINVLITNRLRSQNTQVSAELPTIDKLKINDCLDSTSPEIPIHLLLSTNSIDRTRFISKSLCSFDLILNGKLALLSASICHGEYLFTLDELNFPRKRVDVEGSEYLGKRTESSLVQYLRNINGNTTASQVCCISPLLDSISCFNELASATARRLSLSGIYLRNNYSLPNASEYIREAASEILKSFEKSIPGVIVGYSLGGIIAAEVCALCESSLDVSPKLMIIDTLCPYTLQRSGFMFPEYNLISWANRVVNLKLVLAGFPDKQIQKVHLNSVDDLSDVFDWMVREGFISQQECLDGFYRYLRHGLIQYEAFKQYVPSRISVDTVVVRASIQEPDVNSTLSRMNDLEYLGWSEFLDNRREPLLIKGNHTSIVHGDSAAYNAEILASCISRLIDSL